MSIVAEENLEEQLYIGQLSMGKKKLLSTSSKKKMQVCRVIYEHTFNKYPCGWFTYFFSLQRINLHWCLLHSFVKSHFNLDRHSNKSVLSDWCADVLLPYIMQLQLWCSVRATTNSS